MKKTKLYQKWWFWICIVLIVCVVICVIVIVNNKSIPTSINNTDKKINNYLDNLKESYNSKKLKENPYKATKDYDGIYQFELNSDNGSGYIYTSKGVISFNNGICKIKYSVNSTSSINYDKEYNGFCGINEKDNSTFYFTLNDDEGCELKSYKCSLSQKNLTCELKSIYDLSGCTNNKLDLIYINNATDINTAYTQFKEEQQKQEEKDFKANCKTYTYEQMARNPDKFKGTNVKITGEVIQALYNSNSVDLRVNITKKGTYSTYYTDTVYIVYYPEIGEDKILEDDIITIYGTSQGDYTYTSTIGSRITLPLIYGKYVTTNN